MTRRFPALAMLLALYACGQPAADSNPAEKEAAESPGVTLNAEEVESLGFTTAPGAGGALCRPDQRLWRGDGAGCHRPVPMPMSLTAQAAASQSQAGAARAQSLATGEEAAVSREVVEARQSKAAADQAALALARRKAEARSGTTHPGAMARRARPSWRGWHRATAFWCG